MAKVKVGLLFGGCSGEHEVSISSARAVVQALTDSHNREKYQIMPVYIQKDGRWQAGDFAQQILTTGTPPALPGNASTSSAIQPIATRLDRWTLPMQAAEVDVWFPILHGPNGEDGTLQGLLKLMQVPFVGSGVLGSAVGMDKIAMKMIFAQAGIPQVEYLAVNRSRKGCGAILQVWSNPCIFPKLCDQIEQELGYPCFVKPANLGSSVGVAKVRTRMELEAALDSAASFDRRLIVEAGVTAREVECAVLGNDQPQASVVGEICFASDFYDYETKYTQGLASLKIPAPLPPEITAQIQDLSLRAFAAIDASGIARVDFFYVEATGEVLINEINTMPGFTATSMYPLLWDASGVSFAELVDRLVQLALERAGAA